MVKIWLVLMLIFFICVLCIGAASVTRKGNKVVILRNAKDIFKGCLNAGTYGVPLLLIIFATKDIFGLAIDMTGGVVNCWNIFAVFGLLIIVGIVARIVTYVVFTIGRVAEGAYYLWEVKEYPLLDPEE